MVFAIHVCSYSGGVPLMLMNRGLISLLYKLTGILNDVYIRTPRQMPNPQRNR
jgi:hypothetical protein